MLPLHVDVAVVGGGAVGASVALAAKAAGRSVLLVEARARDADVRDPRVLALSHASQQALAASGIWHDGMPSTPIDRVHVSQAAAFGRTVLDRDDLGLAHLGHSVAYSDLYAAAREALLAAGVPVAFSSRATTLRSGGGFAELGIAPDGAAPHWLTARLVVLADGGGLIDQLPDVVRREHDYHQCAVLARLRPEIPHGNVAFERFSARGPMALLPVGDELMAVWTRSHDDAERLIALNDEAFGAEFGAAFGERLGRLTPTAPRLAVPLRLKVANRIVSRRVALAGNAAQTMHPIAAQGLNLGLRDAALLSGLIARPGDAGDATRLAEYARRRRVDSLAVTGFTHSLVTLFDRQDPVSRGARGAVMAVLDAVPTFRKQFASSLVFGIGG